MKSRPWPLNIFVIFSLFIPMFIYGQMVYLLDVKVTEYGEVFHYLSSWNIGLIFMCLLNIVLCWKAHRLCYLSVVASYICLWGNNLQVYYFESHPYWEMALIGIALSLLPLFFLIFSSRARKVIGTPSLHWWKCAERYQVRLAACLNSQKANLELLTRDVSSSGVYLKMGQRDLFRLKESLQVGDCFNLSI